MAVPARGDRTVLVCDQLTRETLLDALHHLDRGQVTTDEREFLATHASLLPLNRYSELMVSWIRALSAVGTPLNFLARAAQGSDTLICDTREYSSSFMVNPNHAQRVALMNGLTPYRGVFPELLPHSDPGCHLCGAQRQAIDALAQATPELDPLMLRVGSYILQPNRFPLTPLHMMLVKSSHDSTDSRVIPVREGDRLLMPPTQGLSRGYVPCSSDLVQLMTLADLLEVSLVRNHVLDGMSIRFHEHWHALPAAGPVNESRESLIAAAKLTESSIVIAQRSPHTPFDTLLVSGGPQEERAAVVSQLLRALESADQVVRVAFQNGVFLVSPKRAEVVGASPIHPRIPLETNALNFDSPDAVETAIATAYPRGTFPWEDYLGSAVLFQSGLLQSGVTALRSTNFRQEEPLRMTSVGTAIQKYSPLDYRGYPSLGRGEMIRAELTREEQRVWNEIIDFHDKRGDPGHAETVTYFALRLAEMAQCSKAERRRVVLSSMLHDIGWSFIPSIRESFRAAVNERLSGAPASASVGTTDSAAREKALRRLHQELSVGEGARILGAAPDAELILSTIGDHDTREIPNPDMCTKLMWDADHLWRVTVYCYRAYFGAAENGGFWLGPEEFFGKGCSSCTPTTALGRAVMAREVENSRAFLAKKEKAS